MKHLVLPFALLAVIAFHAPAGAEIQMATSAMNNADGQSAGREFADLKKFAHENAQLNQGVTGYGSTKKVGSLKVDKLLHQNGDLGKKMQVDLNSANSPRTRTAIGGAIGGHANDGDEE